ncbi:ABC transporter permease [Neorhizobium sp. P12A]|uniref:ABC transporter permease n=1 Tax=Neorhizobium sp. P12A TaxID=2268027 RepID=UPI0011ECCD8A|nr:ABC transporter permease [Neorhizobium sp. P12A]KAA0693680.1 ABC transporter permease [Neorhizobium sp. P12A]
MSMIEALTGTGRAAQRPRRMHWVWAMPKAPLLLLVPSLAVLIIFLVLPLTVIVADSLAPNPIVQFQGLSLGNYTYLLSHRFYLDVVFRSIAWALITTVLALPLGYVAAMILTTLTGRMANFAMMALTFPILAGPLVVILGWMAILADGGPLFGPLVRWGLIAKPHMMGTDTAVITSMLHFVLPFVILTLYTALKQIPVALNEAARNLGANGLQRFIHVTLPLSAPGIVSASVISFSVSASSYVSPYYIGGASKLTLTTLISQFILATYNSQLAAAAAILLLLTMIVTIAVVAMLLRRIGRT